MTKLKTLSAVNNAISSNLQNELFHGLQNFVKLNLYCCPHGCNCRIWSSDTHLRVNCHRYRNREKESLYHQLCVMLSTDQFIEHLTSLTITNTPLTRVPASVCKLVNLNSLNLDYNSIAALPDNCFSKMTKMTTFSAKNNAITDLRDGLFHGLQSLVKLNLYGNRIASIGLRVFSSFSDLTTFRLVALSNKSGLSFFGPYLSNECILVPGNHVSPVRILRSRNSRVNFRNLKVYYNFRCERKYIYTDFVSRPPLDIAVGLLLREMWCLAQRLNPVITFYHWGEIHSCASCASCAIFYMTKQRTQPLETA